MDQRASLWKTNPAEAVDSNLLLYLTSFFRYKVLMRSVMMPDDPRGSCIQLLHLYDSSSAEWQLGKTKVRTDALCFYTYTCMKLFVIFMSCF